MGSRLRGGAIINVDAALATFEANPELLDRARQRFNDPPPAYSPPRDDDAESTLPETPQPPGPNLPSLRSQREQKIHYSYYNCTPLESFDNQLHDLVARMRNMVELGFATTHSAYLDPVRRYLQQRWEDQGIWKAEWKQWPRGTWKHQDVQQNEERRERHEQRRAEARAEGRDPYGFLGVWPRLSPSPPPVDKMAEFSRPYYQFLEQVSWEREWLLGNKNGLDKLAESLRWRNSPWMRRAVEADTPEESAHFMQLAREQREPPRVRFVNEPEPEPEPEPDPKPELTYDINTRAYEVVKARWKKYSMWNDRWGLLPGMTWATDMSFLEFFRLETENDPLFQDPEERRRTYAILERHENLTRQLANAEPDVSGPFGVGNNPFRETQEPEPQPEPQLERIPGEPYRSGTLFGNSLFGSAPQREPLSAGPDIFRPSGVRNNLFATPEPEPEPEPQAVPEPLEQMDEERQEQPGNEIHDETLPVDLPNDNVEAPNDDQVLPEPAPPRETPPPEPQARPKRRRGRPKKAQQAQQAQQDQQDQPRVRQDRPAPAPAAAADPATPRRSGRIRSQRTPANDTPKNDNGEASRPRRAGKRRAAAVEAEEAPEAAAAPRGRGRGRTGAGKGRPATKRRRV